jgi:hypothetical protein
MPEEEKKNEKVVTAVNPLTFRFSEGHKLEETVRSFSKDTAKQLKGNLPPEPPPLNPIPFNPKGKKGEKE